MKSPAFQFYPNDWLSSRSVRLMDAEQRGWYIQLLCEAWQSTPQCSLPNEPELLWKLAGASDQLKFNERSNLVLTNFYSRSDLLFNARLEAELKKQRAFSKQRSKAGKKSAENRKRTLTGVVIPLNEKPTKQQREINSSSSSSSTSTYIIPESLAASVEFMEAWDKWVAFRKGIKKVKDWNLLFQSQLDAFAVWGLQEAVKALKYSLMNGYTGIFPPKVQTNAPTASTGSGMRTANDARLVMEAAKKRKEDCFHFPEGFRCLNPAKKADYEEAKARIQEAEDFLNKPQNQK